MSPIPSSTVPSCLTPFHSLRSHPTSLFHSIPPSSIPSHPLHSYSIPFHPISFHSIPFYPVLSVASHPIFCTPIPFHPIPSHSPVSLHPTPFHSVPFLPLHSILSITVPSHPLHYHPIPLHSIPLPTALSHSIPSTLYSPVPSHCTPPAPSCLMYFHSTMHPSLPIPSSDPPQFFLSPLSQSHPHHTMTPIPVSGLRLGSQPELHAHIESPTGMPKFTLPPST